MTIAPTRGWVSSLPTRRRINGFPPQHPLKQKRNKKCLQYPASPKQTIQNTVGTQLLGLPRETSAAFPVGKRKNGSGRCAGPHLRGPGISRAVLTCISWSRWRTRLPVFCWFQRLHQFLNSATRTNENWCNLFWCNGFLEKWHPAHTFIISYR